VAIYAIGDIQGCYRDLLALLDLIEFEADSDRLWFTGDLVNRGPESLAVMRYVKQLGDRAIVVLGNHDLHLLACALVAGAKTRRKDTLNEVLDAQDRDELLAWLRTRRLIHHDQELDFCLVHAGILPSWTIGQAIDYAREVEACLHGPFHVDLLANMYGDSPDRWDDDLTDIPRLRFITNCLTRMRFCSREGRVDLRFKGDLGTQPSELRPWFAFPDRPSRRVPVIFGHWSTLNLSSREMRAHNVYPLDTGSVWGGALTALRLEDRRLFSVPASQGIAID
jgi:bis(5'-nucleosyl)-tetraphosphatase (symmetrical)